jgi:membrane-bound lytic murein transglycosylase D
LAREGHLAAAREAFDRAVDVYLHSPGGAYADPRMAEAYERTIDSIHLRELEALAAGDGFMEALPEDASIDEVAEMAVAETAPSAETRRTAEAAVEEEKSDFPVVLNDVVLSCIDLYQGRLREWFGAALARGGRYLPHIREVFASEGIPRDLAYAALVESAFKPSAYSRARARGVWQFISATGKRYGLEQDFWVDDRSDPEKATRAAALYLKELYGMFGDWNLALAGYNAGEGVVARALARHGREDFWTLRKTRAFKRETKNYVPLIHAAIIVAKAPSRYGFDVVPEPALQVEKVPVAGAVDLRVIAECAGTSLDQVQRLNPSLRRLTTPANRTFEVSVPEGGGEALSSCLGALPPDRRVRFRTHVVARGDTLSRIAWRYGTRADDVAAANGISVRKVLPIGTRLIIPASATKHATTKVRQARASHAQVPGSATIRYRVQPGDTLGAIASLYGTTVRKLQSWNGLSGTRLLAGDTLTIYTAREF